MGNNHGGLSLGALALLLSSPLFGCGVVNHGDDGPTATDLSITPSPPRKGQTLHCRYVFEGEVDNSTVRWLVNDIEVATGATLETGFAGGDTVTCEVTPNDGVATGSPVALHADVLHGAIAGAVFLDADGDGLRGESEEGIAGRVLYLDDNRNGALDDGEVSTTSRELGNYEFPDVLPGSYEVAQVDGDWLQTFPSVGAVHADDFDGDALSPARWGVTGNGVSAAGGVLVLDRDEAADGVSFVPSLGGAATIALRMRNTRMNWKDMFHGFQISGPCDTQRNVDGIAFGFSRYGNFFFGQLTCNGATYQYPLAYTIDQWYEFEAIVADGEVRILVDGDEVISGQVPRAELALRMPGLYQDGGAETNTISEIDSVRVELADYSHPVNIVDGEVVDGLDFGTR